MIDNKKDCKCCSKAFITLIRGREASVCDQCFQRDKGKLIELNEYCKSHPSAKPLQIAQTLHIHIYELFHLIAIALSENTNPNTNCDITNTYLAIKEFAHNNHINTHSTPKKQITTSEYPNGSHLLYDLNVLKKHRQTYGRGNVSGFTR